MGAYLPTALGAFIGSVFVAGIIGWVMWKVTGWTWAACDGIGCALTAIGGTANFWKEPDRYTYALIYLAAAIFAFFVLRTLRARWANKPR